MSKTKTVLSIVVSVYNEEKNIPVLYEKLQDELGDLENYKVIFVNDGSYDNSLEVLKELEQNNKNVQLINLSRNFGHEAAMIAGIDKTDSDYTICMDADLQHPPELIRKILSKAREGNSIITLKRVAGKDIGFFKKSLSSLFYWLLNRISSVKLEPNASDFFLIDRKVCKILQKDFRERNRFLRGFIQSIGFRKESIDYVANEREHGKSNYSFVSLLSLSVHAIIAFSKKPLYIGLYLGVIFGFFSIIVTIYSIIMKMTGSAPPGYTTIVVVISALFAIQFFIIGIIGVYIGFLFEEQKMRPLYLVDNEPDITDEISVSNK